MFDVSQREMFSTKIVEFCAFAKRVTPLFESMKNGLAKQLTTKQYTLMGYQELTKILDRYEDLNLQHYVEHQGPELIFNNP
jgi:hypothetical protein